MKTGSSVTLICIQLLVLLVPISVPEVTNHMQFQSPAQATQEKGSWGKLKEQVIQSDLVIVL